MKERVPEFKQTTVKEQLLEALASTSLQEDPSTYLDLLDNYEREDLREKQERRREVVFEKTK